MTWTLVGLGDQAVVASGDLTLTEPAGAAANDLLVAPVAFRSDAPFSMPPGWTEVAQILSSDTSNVTGQSSALMAYCTRGASAPSLTFARTGGDVALGQIICYRPSSGVPTIDDAASALSAVTDQKTLGGLTTSAPDALLVFLGAGETSYRLFKAEIDPATAGSANGVTDTTTNPTAGVWIERRDSITSTGNDTGLAVADAIKSVAGETGTLSVTSGHASAQPLIAAAFIAPAGGDTTAPTLTSPSATATGATTASGSVSTNEANGTLYYLASANASESVATVKAGSSQAVSVSGVQNVTLTGLTASTSYYLHFVHTDAAANDSTVATSAQFTTSAAGDTTPPTLTGPTGTATGATTASGTVSTNEDTGTLYWLASANASETGTAVKAGSSQAVSAVGTQNVTVSGLTASTAYYLHYLHRDGAGNDSDVATSAQFTTSAPPDTTAPTLAGSVTFASITQTSYTAQWPAGSDNVGVTGYEYQIGGTAGAWTDAGNSLSAAITGRTAGTTETVYVRAYDAAGNRSTPAISGEVTLLAAVAGVTVTEPLKNNTGTVLASQSGVRVAVLQSADLVSVYETAGLTTNASGILATISDAAITAGQQYHVAIKLADGSVGITGPITAS